MNIPVNGAAPSTLTLGDVFTTSTDTHLQFQDSSNTTQALAFMSDVTTSNASVTAETLRATAAEGVLTASVSAEVTRAGNAETALGVAITAGDAATLSSANGYTDAEKTRALAAEALKANLAGGNIFTTGSQALAASTTAYPTMNIPVNGAAPSTLTLGDVFTTSTDTHLQFQDSSNTTQALAFLSDVTNNNSSLLGAEKKTSGGKKLSR